MSEEYEIKTCTKDSEVSGGGCITTSSTSKDVSGCITTHNAECSKLEQEEKRYKDLLAERESWEHRADVQTDADRIRLARQIENCEAKIKIYSQKVLTKPLDTSAEEGMCMACYDEKAIELIGCEHPRSVCESCYTQTKNASPIEYFNRVHYRRYRFDAAKCMLCRRIVVMAGSTIEYRLTIIHISFENKRRKIFVEIMEATKTNDLGLIQQLQNVEEQLHIEECYELEKIHQELEKERRLKLIEERRIREEAWVIECNRISRINLETRERIDNRVRFREGLRCMIARGEPLPHGTILPQFPERLRNCCVTCRIPTQGPTRHDHTPMFIPDVIVVDNTRCTVCHQFLFSTWEEQSIVVCRAEEERRVNDQYQAMLVDQERHALVTLLLNEKDRLFAEVNELERPLRERLEQELLAAGGNLRACERARAKFERELEEAQRKWNRKNRR